MRAKKKTVDDVLAEMAADLNSCKMICWKYSGQRLKEASASIDDLVDLVQSRLYSHESPWPASEPFWKKAMAESATHSFMYGAEHSLPYLLGKKAYRASEVDAWDIATAKSVAWSNYYRCVARIVIMSAASNMQYVRSDRIDKAHERASHAQYQLADAAVQQLAKLHILEPDKAIAALLERQWLGTSHLQAQQTDFDVDFRAQTRFSVESLDEWMAYVSDRLAKSVGDP